MLALRHDDLSDTLLVHGLLNLQHDLSGRTSHLVDETPRSRSLAWEPLSTARLLLLLRTPKPRLDGHLGNVSLQVGCTGTHLLTTVGHVHCAERKIQIRFR